MHFGNSKFIFYMNFGPIQASWALSFQESLPDHRLNTTNEKKLMDQIRNRIWTFRTIALAILTFLRVFEELIS